MAVHFHPLKVKKIIRETPECVSVVFEVPETLAEQFSYKEGQNITLRRSFNGEEQRRSYSICTSPAENLVKVAIKKQAGGLFSGFANDELKQGDEVDVMSPTGRFNAKLTEGDTGKYLAIAAGSGITPVLGIIKHTLATQPNSEFTLVYGNRTRGSIIFFEELEALKNKYLSRFNLINVLSKERTDAEINYGRIDEAKLRSLAPLIDYSSLDAVYICGPEQMIFTAKDFLGSLGLDEKKLNFELFTTPGQSVTKIKTSDAAVDEGPKSHITIKLDGRSMEFDLAYNSRSILDGALAEGADLPYACKGGVCATCKAKLLSGEVSMDVNYALEPDEVENGFILTCQSHPKTQNVIVDFDIK